ncbi:hypothetical protein [Halorubrum sp. BOL3-1]|uniref:hypothetical protein n=1 Tax=Halorubrum sp. BOL3-1 TaxID=2497325 RepID=UPI0019D587CF|nr:hypothetical protein [Halorubrum sp. BOL3-1]
MRAHGRHPATRADSSLRRAGERGARSGKKARLDQAALVAALTETLSDGFIISRVNGDGYVYPDENFSRY